jgi:hypothetical protein
MWLAQALSRKWRARGQRAIKKAPGSRTVLEENHLQWMVGLFFDFFERKPVLSSSVLLACCASCV